jgi:hypothetical protein
MIFIKLLKNNFLVSCCIFSFLYICKKINIIDYEILNIIDYKILNTIDYKINTKK